MRGYQKRVIYLKNTGSRQFEEAYFVLRPDDNDGSSEKALIEEANRIINENFEKKKRRFLYSKRWHILAFCLGCAFTLLACFFIFKL